MTQVASIKADARLPRRGYLLKRKLRCFTIGSDSRHCLRRCDSLTSRTRQRRSPLIHKTQLWSYNDEETEQEQQTSPVEKTSQSHEVGEVLDERYRVEQILGKGGNAVTLKCTRLSDDMQVAIKFLSLRSVGSWKELELFEREAQVLQQLSHPNIPAYVDYFEIDTATDRRFYIVQELADGMSLAELVESGVRISDEEVRRIAAELLDVLLYLSKLRPPVIHRDVKPENVILGGGKTGGKVYLVDFGGVQSVGVGLPSQSTIVGTYGYMAPEQFRGMADVKSDLYGLGATLLYLISGRHPTSFPQERLKLDFYDSIETSTVMTSLLDALLEPLLEDRIDAESARAMLQGGMVSSRLYRQPDRMNRPRRKSKPAGARSTIRRRGPTNLEIDIPSAGLSGVNWATGSFALAWNAFVLFWSYSAVISGGILPLLFSIPFWYAGAEITKLSIANSLLHQNLKITPKNFYLTKELDFLRVSEEIPEVDDIGNLEDQKKARKQITGKTKDMTRPQITTAAVVNGSPQTCIEFSAGVQTFLFGEGLTQVEQEWLVDEITTVLQIISDDFSD